MREFIQTPKCNAGIKMGSLVQSTGIHLLPWHPSWSPWEGNFIRKNCFTYKKEITELHIKSVDGLGPCHPISFHCSEIRAFKAMSGKAAFHNDLSASLRMEIKQEWDSAVLTLHLTRIHSQSGKSQMITIYVIKTELQPLSSSKMPVRAFVSPCNLFVFYSGNL